MTEDYRSLLTQAAAAHDALDYHKAIALYREALLLGPPTPFILSQLAAAEEFERLRFRRELLAKYPNDPLCLLDKALVQRSLGLHRDAHRTMLAINIADVAEHDVRQKMISTRFKCTLEVGATNHLLDDFRFLWEEDAPAQHKRHKRILEDIFKCLFPAIRPFLDAVCGLPKMPDNVVQALKLHHRLLDLLASNSGPEPIVINQGDV